MSPEQALKTVFDVVGKTKLARALGLTPQAVRSWKRTPAEHVLRVEAVVKAVQSKRVTRFDLRPDIYPRRSKG